MDKHKRLEETKSENNSDFLGFLETNKRGSDILARGTETDRLRKKTQEKKGEKVENTVPANKVERKISKFLNERGLLELTKLINSDVIFQIWIHMDMSKAQYDNIRRQYPSSVEGNLTLIQIALDHKPDNQKLNCLIHALDGAGQQSLAGKIMQLWSTGENLVTISTM